MKKLITLLLFMGIASLASAQIVITEINYNGPESGTDSTEFIEIYNNSDSSIDLQGYQLTSGIAFTFYGGVNIDAGEFIVITVDSTLMLWQDVNFQVYEWSSGALSNGGEPLAIKNASGELIDTLRYDDAAPWPSEPDGNGPTLELLDVDSDNTDAANWGISSETYGSPGEWGNTVPVELTNFAANVVDAGIELKWTTATEVNNKGFEILRSTDNVNFDQIAFVDGYGTTTEVKNYSFVDANVTGGSYIYKLKQVDYNGTFEYSDAVEVTFAPENFELSQNYPNPFNPSTTISFTVPENVDVKLDVYNTIGQKVTTLVNSVKEAGKYDVKFDASELTSGIYFYVITAGDFKATRKMMLIK